MSKDRKLAYVQTKKLSPADDLRETLSQLEKAPVIIKLMDSEQVLALLHDLDKVYETFDRLETGGQELQGERGRLEAIEGRLKSRAGRLLRILGGTRVLHKQQPVPAPPREKWWWYLDEVVAARYRHILKRAGIGLLIVLMVGGVLAIIFNTVLRPDPQAMARLNAMNDASSAGEQQDYRQALIAIEEGLAKVPDDPELLTFKGILQTLTEDPEAEQTFAQALAGVENPSSFYVHRGQLYLRLFQLDYARQDAETVLELDKNDALGWLLLGQAAEGQGDYVVALEAYDTASELALANDQNEVYVLARMSFARLSQSPPLPMPNATAEESPK